MADPGSSAAHGPDTAGTSRTHDTTVATDSPKVDFNDVFSLRKPKDAKAGLASGLKSMGKGITAGVVGLVAAPVIGAKQQGIVGFGKGLAAGVVGAVVLPVTGVTVGTVQMVRGVCNTAEAVSEHAKGKIWDEERRVWINKPDGTIITADAAKASTRNFHRKPAPGVDYYEVLQVTREATPEQIKKSYYLLARKWHPDKNPGDATAHEKFQLLGEAYQVLGNAELREKYDTHGAEGLDVNFMDGGEFFNMLFGNDLFEHLVGELAIAAAARSGGEMTHAQMKAIQAARIEKLAINLKAMLQRYVAGDVEGFKMAMQAEASQLAAASFGETMLHALGRVYEQQADIHMGGIFGSLAAKMKASTENMKSQINAASAAIKVYQAQQKIEQWQRDQERKVVEEAEADSAAAAAAAAAAAVQATADSAAAAAAAGLDGGAQPAAAAIPDDSDEDAAAAAAKKQAAEQAIAAARQALEEAALPLMLEAMWAANVLDIQTTLRKVCIKILQEPNVPHATLKARGLALKELGIIFGAAKAPAPTTLATTGAAGGEGSGAGARDGSSGGVGEGAGAASSAAGPAGAPPSAAKEARRQMEEAMMRVMEKRAGREHEESH